MNINNENIKEKDGMFVQEKNSILIVDDSEMNIAVLISILGNEYTFYVSQSGRDAIEISKKKQPDLILLDVIMPEIDGFEVISILKNMPKTCKIPVIFITGLEQSQNEERGLALGAVDYIRKPFSPTIVKLRVKNQLQIINQMRLIHRLSNTDELTNASNRRHFNAVLNKEWQRSVRTNMPLGLFMLDVDHFKNYNDTHGHMQGDVALKLTADTIREKIRRPTDLLARWGGEEFAVLLPGADLPGVCKVAEDIRMSIESRIIPCKENIPSYITASIGANSIIPTQNSSKDSFISEADKALYLAKKTGRNKVCTPAQL